MPIKTKNILSKQQNLFVGKHQVVTLFRPNKQQVLTKLLIACLLSFSLLAAFVPAGQVAADEDYIRLAWQERSNLNPLKIFDASGRAVLPLVYRGLFYIDDAESLRTDLAAKAEWSADHLALRIELKRDESFSNGAKISSRDVALSILYYRFYLEEYLAGEDAPAEDLWQPTEEAEDTGLLPKRDLPQNYLVDAGAEIGDEFRSESENAEPGQADDDEESTEISSFAYDEQLDYLYGLRSDPWGIQSLRSIDKISLLNQDSLVIHLSQIAERLPWHLTLPIIPQKFMEEFEQPIPGTGAYKFAPKGERSFLEPVSQANRSKYNLELISYSHFSQALEAFSDGMLDLLFCPQEYFLNLTMRTDLKMISQETGDYYYLKCGFAQDFPLAYAEGQELLRHGLNFSPANRYITSDWPYCLRQGDWRRRFVSQLSLTGEGRAWTDLRTMLADNKLILAAESTAYNRYIVDGLRNFFRQLDIPLKISWVDPEDYTAFAQSGRYDLLLCHTVLSYPLDIQVLRQEISDLSPYLAAFALPTVSADDLVSPLFAYGWDLDQDKLATSAVRDYYRDLRESLAGSGIFELFFAPQGLLISPRIVGMQNPPAWDVYRGIEDLEIWE